MNYQTYKKNLVIVVLCLIAVFMADIFNESLHDASDDSWFSMICFYLYRILFLYLLCFSIFAALSRVKDVRKLEHPMIFVIFGFLMVILTFGYPVATYLIRSNINITKIDVYNATQLEEIKQRAMSMNIASSRRYYSAQKYFNSTGEIIPYLNEQNKKVFFAPSEQMKNARETAIKYNNQIDSLEKKFKRDNIMLFGLIPVLVFFAAGFSAFLWHKFLNT
jgi:hypothetical protein